MDGRNPRGSGREMWCVFAAFTQTERYVGESSVTSGVTSVVSESVESEGCLVPAFLFYSVYKLFLSSALCSHLQMYRFIFYIRLWY